MIEMSSVFIIKKGFHKIGAKEYQKRASPILKATFTEQIIQQFAAKKQLGEYDQSNFWHRNFKRKLHKIQKFKSEKRGMIGLKKSSYRIK